MNDTNGQASEKHPGLEMRPVDRWLRYVTLSLMFIGTAPILLDMAQVKFLPSPAFTEASRFVAYFFAVSVATGSMFVFWFTSTPKRWLSQWTGKPPSDSKSFFSKLALPCLLAFYASMVVTNVYPMVRAALSGEEITLGYIIERVHIGHVKGCSDGAQLQSLRFLSDNVCGIPEPLRRQLEPGTRIELTGWGTEDGLFYNSIRIVEGN